MSDKIKPTKEWYQPTGMSVRAGVQPIKNTIDRTKPPIGGSGVPPKGSGSSSPAGNGKGNN